MHWRSTPHKNLLNLQQALSPLKIVRNQLTPWLQTHKKLVKGINTEALPTLRQKKMVYNNCSKRHHKSILKNQIVEQQYISEYQQKWRSDSHKRQIHCRQVSYSQLQRKKAPLHVSQFIADGDEQEVQLKNNFINVNNYRNRQIHPSKSVLTKHKQQLNVKTSSKPIQTSNQEKKPFKLAQLLQDSGHKEVDIELLLKKIKI